MNTFFTADTHFGHEAILRHDQHWLPPDRGVVFASIDDRDDYIISRWNEVVGVKDEVWHLGDFCFLNDRQRRPVDWYTDKLNGRIHLVLGNHDDGDTLRKWPWCFSSIQDYRYLRRARRELALLHYPMVSWRGSHRGSWHLHGHTHGSLSSEGKRRLDVGIMAHGYRPWAWDEVVMYMEQADRVDTNHHEEMP